MFLEPDQPRDTVFRRKPLEMMRFVLGHASMQVVGMANIERAIALAGEDVDGEGHERGIRLQGSFFHRSVSLDSAGSPLSRG